MEKRTVITLITGLTALSIVGIITYVVVSRNKAKKAEAQLLANVKAELDRQAAAAKVSTAKKKTAVQKLLDVDWGKVSNVANTVASVLKKDE